MSAPADAPTLRRGDYFQRRVAGRAGFGPCCSPMDARRRFSARVRNGRRPRRACLSASAARCVRLQSPTRSLRRISEAAQKIVARARPRRPEQRRFSRRWRRLITCSKSIRAPAQLSIFSMDRDGALFAAHLAACRGHLPRRPLVFTKAAATAIAYAPRELPSMPRLAWPDWCKDRQRPGTFLRAGDPVCTLSAEADTAAAARARVGERLALFDDYLLREAQKECAA